MRKDVRDNQIPLSANSKNPKFNGLTETRGESKLYFSINILNIYLFERQRERQREREEISHLLVHSPVPTTRPGWNQEPRSPYGSPTPVVRTQVLGSSSAASQHIKRSWIRNSAAGTQLALCCGMAVLQGAAYPAAPQRQPLILHCNTLSFMEGKDHHLCIVSWFLLKKTKKWKRS